MNLLINVGNHNIEQPLKPKPNEVDLRTDHLQKKNYLGEFTTNEEKREARKNLDITSDNIPYKVSDFPNVSTVKEALDTVLYTLPKILEFTITPNIIDSSYTAQSITLQWKLSKIATQIVITDGEIIYTPDIKSNQFTINKQYKKNTVFTLTAYVGTEKVSKSVELQFINPLFYGTYPLFNLDSKLVTTETAGTVNVIAKGGEYIYILSPKELILSVNGFIGGFELLKDRLQKYTNFGTIDYYVYKSDNTGLGNTDVVWQQK